MRSKYGVWCITRVRMRIEKRAIADANDTEGYANGKEMSASDAINSP